jgi:D-amino-acid dehydrogenase
MQAGKGYSLTLARPPAMPKICAILTEARATCTPMLDGLRFAGTMEITGLDESINARRVRGLIKSIGRFYPELPPETFAGAPVWRGLRPCPPDGLPYLGRSDRQPNLVVATGHAMMGLSLGPITGKLVAALSSGDDPGMEIGRLNPERFMAR